MVAKKNTGLDAITSFETAQSFSTAALTRETLQCQFGTASSKIKYLKKRSSLLAKGEGRESFCVERLAAVLHMWIA